MSRQPVPTWPIPSGGRWVVEEDTLGWSLEPAVVARVAERQRCRYAGPETHAPGERAACGRPIVAVLFRGSSARPYGYCERHMYGRWIEDGKVVSWRVAR